MDITCSMDPLDNILIFKTNIHSIEDVDCVRGCLNNNQFIEKWNVDLHDADRVLRIVSPSLKHE